MKLLLTIFTICFILEVIVVTKIIRRYRVDCAWKQEGCSREDFLQEQLSTMCERCTCHSECQGTGCNPRKVLQEAINYINDIDKTYKLP